MWHPSSSPLLAERIEDLTRDYVAQRVEVDRLWDVYSRDFEDQAASAAFTAAQTAAVKTLEKLVHAKQAHSAAL